MILSRTFFGLKVTFTRKNDVAPRDSTTSSLCSFAFSLNLVANLSKASSIVEQAVVEVTRESLFVDFTVARRQLSIARLTAANRGSQDLSDGNALDISRRRTLSLIAASTSGLSTLSPDRMAPEGRAAKLNSKVPDRLFKVTLALPKKGSSKIDASFDISLKNLETAGS